MAEKRAPLGCRNYWADIDPKRSIDSELDVQADMGSLQSFFSSFGFAGILTPGSINDVPDVPSDT